MVSHTPVTDMLRLPVMLHMRIRSALAELLEEQNERRAGKG